VLPGDRPLGQQLGAFVAGSDWAATPPALRHEAKRSLLNFAGCAIGVARSEPVEAAARALRPFAGAPQATVIGRAERLDVLSAAFLNAISANLLDYDDTHLSTVIHPTAPVAPGVLALAEWRGLGGAAALHAFILGAEVECRIGNAVSPGHYARGWHITSSCGVFGAAAAAARLLGLDAEGCWHALGIAASQSSGLVENLPAAAKNAAMGSAARNGVVAALMAAEGYRAAPLALEGPFGWMQATGGEARHGEVTEGLGVRWELLRNTYKPYPCGIVFHAVIDACLVLRAEHGLRAEQIADVTVLGDQLLLDRGSRPVTGERDAKISIRHCAAIAFLYGRAGLEEFSDGVVMRPELVAFRDCVRAQRDDALPMGAATVRLRTTDGRALSATVHHPRGSEQYPLTDEEIEEKVRDLARYGAWPANTGPMIKGVWALEDALDIAPLMRTLRLNPQ
jgi:2-methylcitrate dehydratase PrpD